MALQYLVDYAAENLSAVIATALVAVICAAAWLMRSKAGSSSLPGPWSLPVVGNIFLFGSSPHRNVTNLAKHYGEVFSMKLGSMEAVILNSVDVVKEALVKRASDFSGRPPLHTFLLSSNGGRNVAFTDFGKRYIQNRRALDLALQTQTQDSVAFTEKIQAEADALVCSLLNSRKEKFNPSNQIGNTAASLQFRLFFGERLRSRYLKEAQELIDHSTDFIENSAVGNMVDFMPWVKTVFKNQVRKVEETVRSLTTFIRKLHQLRMREIQEKGDESTTIADTLIKIKKNQDKYLASDEDGNSSDEDDFDNERVINLIADSFGGGYEKLGTAMKWFVAYLVAYPEAQEQLYQEIAHVKGTNPISLEDKKKLPLLEATVLEVLRRSCFLPFALPHCTVRDTTVAGFKLPKDTIVFVNLWGCCHDPKYFKDPFKFNPLRHLDTKQQQVKPNSCMMAFSDGDRRCPGEGYAKSALFILMGTLVQKLRVRNGTEEPIEEKFGLTLRPKSHSVKVQAR
ncbi:cytochrome P450 1A1 [Nematostella vectensis]|uniref:cytochrome P450 1A1 n=1 Tax=Nematostella vectensis TaxID=45351 RepID=UPI00207756EF|nr:cytochrome P450 1A1 [Nematostella vectensis]